MPSRNDRVVQRIRAERAVADAEAASALEDARRALLRTEAERVARTRALIERFLSTMAAADFPGVDIFALRRAPKSAFIRKRRRVEYEEVAGWIVVGRSTMWSSDAERIVLLLDGRLFEPIVWSGPHWLLDSVYELRAREPQRAFSDHDRPWRISETLEVRIPEGLSDLLRENGLALLD